MPKYIETQGLTLNSESKKLIEMFDTSHYDRFSIKPDSGQWAGKYFAEAYFVSPAMKFWDRDNDPDTAVKKLFARIQKYLDEENLVVKTPSLPGNVIRFVDRN